MVHPEHAGLMVIGQMGAAALRVLGFGVRAPAYVPDGLAGFLFEAQWWYWVLAIAAGVALFFAGRNRANRGMVMTGSVLIAWLVVTPAERLRREHEELAAAATRGDVAGIVSHLAPDFQCAALGVTKLPEANEVISADLKKYGIRTNRIRNYKSDISGPTAYTQLTLLTESDFGPVITRWGLSWDDLAGDDWKIKVAELKGVGDSAMPEGQRIP